MANKVKITDGQGVQVFPITHVSAVIDNNGNSIDNLITATISVGTVTTVDAGENAQITNTGTEKNAVLNFKIPQGQKGDTVVLGDGDEYTLYNVPGQNTDGAMTQKAVTNNFVATENSGSESDLDITNEFDQVLARFYNGQIKTKHFDSATDAPTKSGIAPLGDFEIADEYENIIFRLKDGHIQTKLFDSSNITTIGNNLINVFKNVICIGDSIMAGYTKIGNVNIGSADARPLKNNWPGYLEQMTNSTYTNLAIGSSTAHNWRYGDGPTSTYYPDFSLANNPNADMYIVALGGNDERFSITVGTSSSISSSSFANNSDDFTGNYDFVIRQLRTWNPRAHIFCLSIPLAIGNNVSPYNDMIQYVCELYPSKVHMITFESENVDLDWAAHGYANGHYCPIVYNYFASIIYYKISKFIWDNYSLFFEVPYV